MSAAPYLVDTISLPAASDLSSNQFHFVKLGGSGLALPSAGGRITGVLEDKPDAAGEYGAVRILGPARVMAGGAFSEGDAVKTDANGRAVQASASDIADGAAVGEALEDATSGTLCAITLLPSAAGVADATGDETVTDGALTVGVDVSYLSVTGTQAYTLADGEHTGQRKRIECSVAASTPLGTLTLATAAGSEPTTHVFTTVGQALELVWQSGGWHVIGKTRVGELEVVVGTDVLTGDDMVARYNLSVTGTVTASGANAIPDGLVTGEQIDIQVTTAASIPDGEININGVNLDNTAVTKIDDIDGTTSHYAKFRWDGAAWALQSITGLTVA